MLLEGTSEGTYMKLEEKVYLSERFEAAFNRIHGRLKKLARDYRGDKFVDLVDVNFKKHSVIRQNRLDLIQFAKLRNAIVHEKVGIDYYIAEPHLDVVEKIEEIANKLESPVSALTISTKPVTYFDYNSSILTVLDTISKKEFSQFPIYKGNECVGILTEGGLLKYIQSKLINSTVAFSNVKVLDVLSYEKKHAIEFMSLQANVYDVEEVYWKYLNAGNKLESIVITQSGKKTEKPLGIITSWDLVKNNFA